jgi:integrase
MRLYRRSYRTRTGEARTARRWSAEWRDDGRVCRVTLFTERKASDEAARKISRLISARDSGDVLEPELVRWLESMPTAIRTDLARLGVVEDRRLAATVSIKQHIADFEAHLASRGNTVAHVGQTTRYLTTMFAACGFKVLSDLSASKIEHHLTSRRKDQKRGEQVVRGISPRTSNSYLTAACQFARWAVQEGRLAENPLSSMRPMNGAGDVRRKRRALDVEEARWLIRSTRDSGPASGMGGEERAILYLLATESGLRANELHSLRRSSFDLDGPEPCVRVEAAYSKRRRADTLPLRPTTVTTLRQYLKPKLPAAPAFDMPKSTHTAAMLAEDLSQARELWLESLPLSEREAARSSDFLAPVDHAGRVVDFHALRHTFISSLARSGVHPRTAQALARHSTINLTMNACTPLLKGDEAAALATLPGVNLQDDPDTNRMRATGTDGRPADVCAGRCAASDSGGISLDLAGHLAGSARSGSTSVSQAQSAKITAPNAKGRSGIRTHEQRICNPPH